MINRFLSLALAVAMLPAMASAQAPTSNPAAAAGAPVVGMAVVDAKGGAVGTITALAADGVTVKTDRHLAVIPRSGVIVNKDKAIIGMTQVELNAQIEMAIAAAPKLELAVGGTVKGSAGTSIGTLDAVSAESVTIKLSDGKLIAIPRTSIAAESGGGGKIALTAAQLDAMVQSQPKAEPTAE
ncbi:MAG: hypothetical protein V4696_06595 [Pseudomonadota bacterium]